MQRFLRRATTLLSCSLWLTSIPSAVCAQAAVKTVTACSSNASDPDAPVIASLTTTFGADTVQSVRTFIADTAVGKLLVTSDASTCLANMDGSKLSDAIVSALASSTCAAMPTVANLPFVQHLVGNMTAHAELPEYVKLLRNVSSVEVDEFCGLYVNNVVPCLTSELLPAIATVRAKYAGGCCDAWASSAVKDFGYSVSDQLTKYAQLFGDLMCSTQTPSFQGNASQRCGYTFIHSTLSEQDEEDAAIVGADLITDLQVPTDQMCLYAEGSAYVDVNGGNVAASSLPSASGCVVVLDRAWTWASSLPIAQRTDVFDVQALFDKSECLKGSEFFPVVQDFFPADVVDVVRAYFGKACVHIPIKYADSCTYARPISLLSWAAEPSRVKAADLDGSSTASASDPTANIVSEQTVAPTASAAVPSFRGMAAAMLTVLAAWGLC
uniref:Uncharacterized protein n=1 Tax=Globisporangium ultimum (strain ATCC 200006 / CBS 805.95 / DAOM BR144) TaxID=431595 RepID=K3XCA3_GLOUD